MSDTKTDREIILALVDYGLSYAKAYEILLDVARGQEYASQWVKRAVTAYNLKKTIR